MEKNKSAKGMGSAGRLRIASKVVRVSPPVKVNFGKFEEGERASHWDV